MMPFARRTGARRGPPVLIFSLVFLALPAGGYAFAGAKGPGPEALYKKARQAFYAHKDTGNAAMDRQAWIKIGALFEKVYRRFPGSRRADDALFTQARIRERLFSRYKKDKDLNAALGLYQRVIGKYASRRLADDAEWRIAGIYLHAKKDPRRALAAYKKIRERYPEGDKLKTAERMIASLGKKLRQEPVKKKRPVILNAVRHWSNPTYTRIVLDLASSLKFKERRLHGPDRLYVDLFNAVISENMKEREISVREGPLRRIRVSRQRPGVVRVVFDVANLQDFKVFSYENPFRVVIDIRGLPLSKGAGVRAASRGPGKKKRHGPPPVTRIVLDAGHGGKDNGATGYRGIKEKDIVLDIARRLKRKLKNKLRCKVIMTRDRDVFIPLDERTAIANTANADIFVSIHGNAAPRRAAYGIETYFLSNALSERALDTALRENMITTKDMSDDLRFILSDMLANSNMKESSELAGIVQKNLVHGLGRSYSKIKDLGAKGGPFYVLHGANMPSVLVEVGFLSNPMEAGRIRRWKYRDRVADSLYRAVRQYLRNVKLAYGKGK